MSKLVKIVDNKYVQIEEYKNPNICFNTNEYDDFEDYCTLRETFDPFEIFYENKELKKQLEELEKENFNLRENIYINKISFSSEGKNIKELIEMPTYEDLINQQKEFIEYLEDLIKQNETVVKVSKYGLPKNCSKLLIDFYKEILSKYKEIIGDVKNENK